MCVFIFYSVNVFGAEISGTQLLQRLRDDLNRVRELAHQTRRRELRKLRQVNVIKDILAVCLFSHERRLRGTFERIMA